MISNGRKKEEKKRWEKIHMLTTKSQFGRQGSEITDLASGKNPLINIIYHFTKLAAH
jgi:hypothetical protein